MNRKRLTPEMVKMKADGETYSAIGEFLGISRQRVQQIFSPSKAMMEIIADRAKALCEQCGQFDQFGHFHHKVYDFEILNTPENIIYLCSSCHHKERAETFICLYCGQIITGTGKKYCSRACSKAYNSITSECSYCHKDFIMDSSQKVRIRKSQSGLIFCSKRCQGLFFGKYHNVRPYSAQGVALL